MDADQAPAISFEGRGFQGLSRRDLRDQELARGAKKERDAQEGCPQSPTQPYLGGARRSLNECVWAGGVHREWDAQQEKAKGGREL